MKGSDNPFPSILIADTVDPAAPSDGFHRLFIDTDEKLKMIDHASLVTDFTPGAAGNVATDAIWDAAGDLAVGTGANTAAKLASGAAGTVLTGAGVGSAPTWAAPAGGSDLVQVASGVGTIVLPRLAGSADVVPGSPHASDDEFDTTDAADPMTGWTTLGAPDAHNMNTMARSHYYVQRNGGATEAWSGIYKASPSTPFTVTAKIASLLEIPGSNSLVGLFLGEATPGKMVTYSLINYVDTWQLFPQLFTNPTTYNAAMGTGSGDLKRMFWGLPIYLRLVVNSTSNIDFLWSTDGVLWRTMQSAQDPAFTVGSVGVGAARGTGSKAIAALFDWIRFS